MSSYKAPPELNDEKSFKDWKKEIEIWQLATEVNKEKQAAMIFLSLKGKSREAVLELDKDIIGAADGSGVTKVIEKLDSLWKEDENLEAFSAYEKFEQFCRPKDMNIKDYIIQFERLNNKLIACDTKLPEGVLAYRLLKSAGITKEQEQLAKATVGQFTFSAMCAKLKSIFGDTIKADPPTSGNGAAIRVVKTEEEAYCENTYFSRDKQQEYRGRFRDVGRRNNNFRNQRGYVRGNWNQTPNNRLQKNPTNAQGEVTSCNICKSIYHWSNECPHRNSAQGGGNTTSFTCFAESAIQKCYVSKLVCESLSSGLLDCGCTKTVCGKEWYDEFVNSLSEDDKRAIITEESSVPYKFGSGDVIYSYMKAILPVYFGTYKGTLETEIVKTELPLLISKNAMKAIGMVLDFQKDIALFREEELPLQTSSSGHYLISLNKTETQNNKGSNNEALIAINMENKNEKEKKKMAIKLHQQFGHPPYERLAEMIRLAGITDENFHKMLKSHSETCETCQRYGKTNPRPVVGMTLSKEFNSTVAMDLKFFHGDIILHIIDLATRYSNGTFVPDKQKETIVEAVIFEWIRHFGVPGRFLTDNGGEFSNDDMRDMSENLNAEVTTTAAESPWSNGICERHNAIIACMMEKIIDETGCSRRVALGWSNNAKNSLLNHYGFSPYQLVLGKNPNFPSVLIDNLPALSGETRSEEVARHLNVKLAARKAFVECEASDKIRRALRHNVRESTTMIYESGDKVYYRRMKSDCWRGPATVIGKDAHQVIVNHGGHLVRVHPVSLRHVKEDLNNKEQNSSESSTKTEMIAKKVPSNIDKNVTGDQNIDDEEEEYESNAEVRVQNDENTDAEENGNDNEQDISNKLTISTSSDEIAQPSMPTSQSSIQTKEKKKVPTTRKRIEFRTEGSEDCWQEAVVLNRRGKVGGKYDMWMNVQTIPDGKQISVNFDNVEWKAKEEVILLSSNDSRVMEAKALELQNLKDNNVYEVVEDNGQEFIETKWIVTEKSMDENTIVKARLVAKGFQESVESRTDSPTCKKENIRIIIAIAATNKWKIKSLDIKSAFLQGREISREVYVKPPVEFASGQLWKLKKALYGLNDAAREWYLKLNEAMQEMSAQRSIHDNAVFFWIEGNELFGICACHVDDFIVCGEARFLGKLINGVKNRFNVSSECDGIFKYVGLQIMCEGNDICVSQNQYYDDIEQLDLNLPPGTVLDDKQKRDFKSLAGQLNWISAHSRPDLAFDVCLANVSIKDATKREVDSVNKTVRKMKCQEAKLVFPDIGDIIKSKWICYTDAAFANLPGRASQGGYVIFLQGINGKYSPIAWKSKKIKRVVKSTIAAETLALLEGAEHAFALSSFLREITGCRFSKEKEVVEDDKFPITIRTDNRSLDQSVSPESPTKEQRCCVGWICRYEHPSDRRPMNIYHVCE